MQPRGIGESNLLFCKEISKNLYENADQLGIDGDFAVRLQYT